MKAVIQRVSGARVDIERGVDPRGVKIFDTPGCIKNGYMILLGVVEGDTREEAELLAKKVAELRIFSDENGKMNLSVLDVDGSILVVSQFTLCADLAKGRRPSFVHSAAPQIANELYEYFCSQLRARGVKDVQTGEFGADMQVTLVNDGPVTIIMNTDEWRKDK